MFFVLVFRFLQLSAGSRDGATGPLVSEVLKQLKLNVDRHERSAGTGMQTQEQCRIRELLVPVETAGSTTLLTLRKQCTRINISDTDMSQPHSAITESKLYPLGI
jgi:hypothetical protein